jgi:inhibitor of cysteine peptidase
MQYDESANGSEIELSAGAEFGLSLPETPTTGYRWELKAGESECALLSESSQSAKGITGGSGSHSWRFRAPSSGSSSIVMDYKRSWETGAEPERTFTLKVRIRS